MSRKVLLLNAAKRGRRHLAARVHMGLTLLSAILRKAGHDVLIVDYSFLSDAGDRIQPPPVRDVIRRYSPDVIGVSVFTYLYPECDDLIADIRRISDVPVIVGGPHIAIFPEDFLNDPRIDYVVRGEAETSIVDVVEKAKREPSAVRVDAPLPSPDAIPEADLDSVYGGELLTEYQIQLSRGCPFQCSFCNVPKLIAGRKVRKRDVEECVAQIGRAKERHPSIGTITITDDCPTVERERFLHFLELVAQARLGCTLTIDNMRADMIDEDMIDRYVAAGGRNICLGVESGNPEVFKGVGKGESLDTIARAAGIVRNKGLLLGLCFVIGLPGDNMERHGDSIRLAKRLQPDYVFWNMCFPWPGTAVGDWYARNGVVGDLRGASTLIDHEGKFDMPPAATPDFPARQRVRAWLLAGLATYSISWRGLPRLLRLAPKFRVIGPFARWLAGYVPFVMRVKRRMAEREAPGNGPSALRSIVRSG